METIYFEVGQTVYWQRYATAGVVKAIRGKEGFCVHTEFDGKLYEFQADGRYMLNGEVELSQKPLPKIVNEARMKPVAGYFWNRGSKYAIYDILVNVHDGLYIPKNIAGAKYNNFSEKPPVSN